MDLGVQHPRMGVSAWGAAPSTAAQRTWEMLRCVACRKLLAERVSSPYRIRCKCGEVAESGRFRTT
jgi:hypothetical protein